MIAPGTGFPILCAHPDDSLWARVRLARGRALCPGVCPPAPRSALHSACDDGDGPEGWRAGREGEQFAKTPGAAWVESGLAQSFPDSFDQLRVLAGELDRAEAYCGNLLAQWQDLLDREALCGGEKASEDD